MARNEIEGLVVLLDVGVSMSTKIGNTTYLQSCADIINMIVQRKMFQSSKDELGLVLFGTRETANVLWSKSDPDHYSHVTTARPLSIVDWRLLEFVQNEIHPSNIEGDILDGLLVSANHFHEDLNKTKNFKEKRIFILTDFSSSSQTDDKEEMKKICKGLSKDQIRVDVISPFSELDEDEEDSHENNDVEKKKLNPHASASNQTDNQTKRMTKEQIKNKAILKQICEATDGAIYSFDEVLSLLSLYQSKTIKSTGTKYLMTVGDSFKLPIVSVIKCKENKPELFRFKKVYAKDESVDLKTDRARFTKDDEQRDLNDKTDIVDAYRYGSTYVPIDEPELLNLKSEKCFDVLGFTKSENVKRHYYLGDAVQQIMSDAVAGEESEEAFVNMVHAMDSEDVYGLVRRVFSSRSNPELACLIPFINSETTCLLYVALPFEDDVRNFTLENFNCMKKFKPSAKQMELIDQIIENMDLTSKQENDDDDEEELYDPHLTFNPYIQRMFQSIGLRATQPSAELPEFEKHITNTSLVKIGEKIRNQKTNSLLKRCAEEFPTKILIKKSKKEENIFDKKKNEKEEQTNDIDKSVENENMSLNDLLGKEEKLSNRVKKIGTSTPADDFKLIAERLLSNNSSDSVENNFEDLCLQMEVMIKDIFNESLMQLYGDEEMDKNISVSVFQKKSAECIKILREYCIKFKNPNVFNTYLKTFKIFLLKESNNKKYAKHIDVFWNEHFLNDNLTLISSKESESSDLNEEECKEFISKFKQTEDQISSKIKTDVGDEENVEDLLDLM